MIILEGLIGVGKSTLCTNLARMIQYSKCYLEPTEKDNPYLALFYKDMKRYGLEMQYYLLAKRFLLYQEAVKEEWQGACTIHDRSVWGDLPRCSIDQE
jgi:deoxyadenosine/deoxycytidine kinase